MVVNSSTGRRVSRLGNFSGTPSATTAATAMSGGEAEQLAGGRLLAGEERRHDPAETFVARREQQVLPEGVDRAAADDALALEPPVQHREARQVRRR